MKIESRAEPLLIEYCIRWYIFSHLIVLDSCRLNSSSSVLGDPRGVRGADQVLGPTAGFKFYLFAEFVAQRALQLYVSSVAAQLKGVLSSFHTAGDRERLLDL